MTLTYRIPRLLWLWLPLAILVAQCLIEALASPLLRQWWVDENGPLELVQFVILMAALYVGLSTLRLAGLQDHPWLRAWILLACACCFYVGGEEISWGQWFFHWHTPAAWALINDQGETNLHNTSSWLDQKPRLMLEIGTLAGGLLIPLAARYCPRCLPARFAPIYPPAILAVTAGADAFVKFSNIFGNHVLHVHFYMRAAEVTETFMYYFTFLYLMVMRARVQSLKGENP